MAIALEEHDGQTPLDPDEKAGLIPTHLTTMDELNDWEQENILRAVLWVKRARSPDVLTEGFCRTLHAKMFDQTWAWAGTFRSSDKNVIAARFHRDLVWIHPFPNGNGRHARMMADALLRSMGQRPFSWGNAGSLVTVSEARTRYLSALRAADHGDYPPLLAFVRS